MSEPAIATAAPADDLQGRQNLFVLFGGAALAILHLAQIQFSLFPSGLFKAVHLCACVSLVLVCLGLESSRAVRVLFYALAAFSGAALLYICLSYDALISERIFGPNNFDIAVTIVLLIVTLAATTRQWGVTLPLIAGAAILYAYFGNYFPGDLFFHSGIDFHRLASYLAIPSFEGLLGSLTALSANTVFIFMIFAGVLKASGGLRLVLALGQSLAARSRSGPALVAILASGFMGMMSGSTVANVASTGAMTIPLMKKSGFRPAYAGAVEAVASTGGQFTPPVMGLTAFLIVGVTGIPYNTIMLASIAPALVYYGYLISIVHIRAMAEGIRPVTPDLTELTFRQALRRYWHLLFAIALLVILLVRQTPPAIAALYAIGAIVGAETIRSAYFGRRDIAGAMRALALLLLRGLREGAILGAQLAIIMATIGILVDILVITGFAQKLAFLMLNLAGGDLWLLLALTSVACVIFGLGLPTPAAYVLVALLGAPALADAGVAVLHAHMFVFYFANMSAITPPVAVAALVASKIAGAPYFRTCLASLQLGLPGFILPFVFVAYPELLTPHGDFLRQAFYVVSTVAAAVLGSAALSGFLIWRLALWERAAILLAAAGLLFMNYISAASLALLGAVALIHFVRMRRAGGGAELAATADRRNE